MTVFNFGFSAHGAFEGIRYESLENPWIDFIVVVKKEDLEKAKRVILDAVDEYWNSEWECYGNCVENRLKYEQIKYFMFYYDDENTDEQYDLFWENFAENIGFAMSSRILYRVY